MRFQRGWLRRGAAALTLIVLTVVGLVHYSPTHQMGSTAHSASVFLVSAAPAAHVSPIAHCLENRHVRFCIEADASGRWHINDVANHQHGGVWRIVSPMFVLVAWDGSETTSDDCALRGLDAALNLLSALFDCPLQSLSMSWRAELPFPEATFVRLHLTWRSATQSVAPSMIFLLRTTSETAASVRSLGSGFGAVVHHTGKLIYFGAEHPRAANGRLEDGSDVVVAGLMHVPLTAVAATGVLTAVVGTFAEANQRRREFQRAYLDVAPRARAVKPLLHYNSWFDFASWQEEEAQTLFANRTMTEANCLDRVEVFGAELVRKRGVVLDSYLWDDGWDNHSTLWRFHAGFPRGFTRVQERAAEFGAGIGVWMSPWGGYGDAKDSRVAFGLAQGYEAGSDGFLLSDPKYFARFRDTALDMVKTYGVNMFKIDGIGFSGNRTVLGTEMAAMLRLTIELRAQSPLSDLFLSLTTGTWPSPFWLLYGDAVWRGMVDLGLEGAGSPRQQWLTYRDAVVHHRVCNVAPLFPLNSVMLHGIVVGAVGQARRAGLDNVDNIDDFADEVWTFFSVGVTLQELYISPDRMTPLAWDILAEGAKWARQHSHTLADSHWVGGDPVLAQVYGFGAWDGAAFGILTLRNPSPNPGQFVVTLASAWELPAAARLARYVPVCRYRRTVAAENACVIPSPQILCTNNACAPVDVALSLTFLLPAFEVLVLEGRQAVGQL